MKKRMEAKVFSNPISIAVFYIVFAADALVCFLYYPDYVRMAIIGIVGILLAVFVAAAIRIANQWEKAVVLRMGKFIGLKGPGFFMIIPVIDRVDTYIDQRLRVTDVRAEKTLTKDTVPVTVDAVLYWTVWVDESGTIQFRDDIYGRDKPVADALNERLPALSKL